MSRAIALLLTGDVQSDEIANGDQYDYGDDNDDNDGDDDDNDHEYDDDGDNNDESGCYTEPLRSRRIDCRTSLVGKEGQEEEEKEEGEGTGGGKEEEEEDGEQRTLEYKNRIKLPSRPASSPSLQPPHRNPPVTRTTVDHAEEGRAEGTVKPSIEGVQELDRRDLSASSSSPGEQRVTAAAAEEFEYSSGDEHSTSEPRDDLLQSPQPSAEGEHRTPILDMGAGAAERDGSPPQGNAAQAGRDRSSPSPHHRAFSHGGRGATDGLPVQEESITGEVETDTNQYEDDFFSGDDDEEESLASPEVDR